MKKRLAKYWWVELLCCACAAVLVSALLHAAGVDDALPGRGAAVAGLAVWACCFYTIERIVKFAVWAAVLAIAPERAADLP